MKTKQLLIFGAIFVVLAVVILLFENPFGQSEYEKKVETAMPPVSELQCGAGCENRNRRYRPKPQRFQSRMAVGVWLLWITIQRMVKV